MINLERHIKVLKEVYEEDETFGTEEYLAALSFAIKELEKKQRRKNIRRP